MRNFKLGIFILLSFFFIASSVYAKDGIVVNKVYPNSIGTNDSNEYVEVFNNSNSIQNLNGWYFKDDSGTKLKFATTTASTKTIDTISLSLQKCEKKLFYFDKKFNNTGDIAQLYNADNLLIDEFSYSGSFAEDQIAVRNPDASTNIATIKLSEVSDISTSSNCTPVVTTTPPPTPTITPTPTLPLATPTITPTLTPTITPITTPTPQITSTPVPQATITVTPTPELTRTPQIDYSTWKIRINEVAPNLSTKTSTGGVEWVEIYNNDDISHDLNNWILKDKLGNTFKKITSDNYPNSVIESHSYFILESTSSILNNSSEDGVYLYSPDDNLQDKFEYTKTVINQSWNYFNSGWILSKTLTPKEENQIDVITPQLAAIEDVDISKARESEKGTNVTLQGTVTVDPGLIDKNGFYIQDLDSGIKVEFQDNVNIKLGDYVVIKGETNEVRNEKSINLTSIEVQGNLGAPEPKVVKISETGEKLEGQLINTKGKVSKTSGSTFNISDGSSTVTVNIETGTNIKKPPTRVGYFAIITGILSQYGLKEGESYYRILPRYQSDVKIGKTEELANTGQESIYAIIFGFGLLIVVITIMRTRPKYLVIK